MCVYGWFNKYIFIYMYHRNFTFHLQTAEIVFFLTSQKITANNVYDLMQKKKKRKNKGQRGIYGLLKVKSPVRSKNITVRKQLHNSCLRWSPNKSLTAALRPYHVFTYIQWYFHIKADSHIFFWERVGALWVILTPFSRHVVTDVPGLLLGGVFCFG